jgi:hypothetical protein
MAMKLRLWVFLSKKINSFQLQKHSQNIKKPIYQPHKPKKQSKPPNQTGENIPSLTSI